MTTIDEQTTHLDEHVLAARAAEGNGDAFDELCRQHEAPAWNLARAVTLRADDAATALAAGMAQACTALRAGRIDLAEGTVELRTHLLTRVHQASMDRVRARRAEAPAVEDRPSPLADASGDPHLTAAFAALPARWRGPLWLEAADGLDHHAIASVTELPADDVPALLTRARRGLVEQYLRTPAVGTPPRACRRAVARLGRHVAGTLPAGDREKLDRHLSLCESCTALHARLATLDAGLPLLSVAVPVDVHDRTRSAWMTAAASGRGRSGMSERAEKVVAAVSAFAAAVGVVGAALFALSDDDGDGRAAAASPLAPLVDEVATPSASNLSDGIAIPASSRRGTGSGIAAGAIETAASTAADPALPRTDPIAATGPEAPTEAADAPDDGILDDSPVPVPDGLIPDEDISLEVLDQPIEVDLDDDPNVTVGPISTDSGSDSTSDGSGGDEPVETDDTLDAAEPVTDTVDSTVDDTVTTTEDSLGL